MSDADMTIDPSDIDDSLISLNARKVIRRLNEAGYQAYLVGGGVRDLLLGLTPKDFEDRKSTRLNSSHSQQSRMPSSA